MMDKWDDLLQSESSENRGSFLKQPLYKGQDPGF